MKVVQRRHAGACTLVQYNATSASIRGYATCIVAAHMARILAGTYDTANRAGAVMRSLLAAGVPHNCLASFHNNPPGQHGTLPIGGLERRPVGIIVAVAQPGQISDEKVIEILKASEPVALEESEGEVRGGEWKDFDPLAPPRLRE